MSSSLSPRLASSRQWTDLPAEFLEKVQSVFKGQFDIESENGEFLVEGRVYPEEVVVRVGYLENGRLKQINFEASMDRPKSKKSEEEGGEQQKASTLERLYVCIDALGSVMEEYFNLGEEDAIDIPIRWKAYEFENETVYMQHSTVNSRLEEEADRILGLLEKSLVREEATSDDALGNAEVDTELALEIQKAIRAGIYPRPEGLGSPDGDSEPEH